MKTLQFTVNLLTFFPFNQHLAILPFSAFFYLLICYPLAYWPFGLFTVTYWLAYLVISLVIFDMFISTYLPFFDLLTCWHLTFYQLTWTYSPPDLRTSWHFFAEFFTCLPLMENWTFRSCNLLIFCLWLVDLRRWLVLLTEKEVNVGEAIQESLLSSLKGTDRQFNR